MKKFITAIVLMTVLTSCIGGRGYINNNQLTSISIVDRNGFSETMSSEERLNQYGNVNFLNPLPYQKVIRVFKRRSNGDIKSIITSYYPNGQIKQYLDVINGRASGSYKEWYSNGIQKVDAYVVGGTADIETAGDGGWLFDGLTRAWSEEGHLQAEIPYEKGVLQGIAKYYHPNGKLWKSIPSKGNKAEGKLEVFLEDGTILSSSNYQEDQKHGESIRYWTPTKKASVEYFREGFLISGEYYGLDQNKISEVVNGTGKRALFSKNFVSEYQSIENGLPNGECRVFNQDGKLIRKYSLKNDIQNGEEVFYYETLPLQQPKLSIEWVEGIITGTVKTWYPNGQQESKREMESNIKNGLSTAWYTDGQIMLIEDYQKEKLIRGKYFKKGEKNPVSKVENGMGVAFIYDGQGTLISKIPYLNGRPIEDKGNESN